MHPFTVILGVVSGSLLSIAFGLCVVLLVFWVLQGDHPRFRAELPEVARSAAMFTTLAAVAAMAMFGTLRSRPWRYPVLAALWLGLLLVAWVYWPR